MSRYDDDDDDVGTTFTPVENKLLVSRVEHVEGLRLEQNCKLARVVKISRHAEVLNGPEVDDIIMYTKHESMFHLGGAPYYVVDLFDVLGTVTT